MILQEFAVWVTSNCTSEKPVDCYFFEEVCTKIKFAVNSHDGIKYGECSECCCTIWRKVNLYVRPFVCSQNYLNEHGPLLTILYAMISTYSLPSLQEDARWNQDVQSDSAVSSATQNTFCMCRVSESFALLPTECPILVVLSGHLLYYLKNFQQLQLQFPPQSQVKLNVALIPVQHPENQFLQFYKSRL